MVIIFKDAGRKGEQWTDYIAARLLSYPLSSKYLLFLCRSNMWRNDMTTLDRLHSNHSFEGIDNNGEVHRNQVTIFKSPVGHVPMWEMNNGYTTLELCSCMPIVLKMQKWEKLRDRMDSNLVVIRSLVFQNAEIIEYLPDYIAIRLLQDQLSWN